MKFTLDEFNPTVEELTTLSTKYKGLKISWIDDKEWYEIVKRAQLDLWKKRVHIVKTLKEYRNDAIQFQKKVIQQEKDLVAIIEWTEDELKEERKRIDIEIEMEMRKKMLPERYELLKGVWHEMQEEEILKMDWNAFNFMIQMKKQQKFEAEKRKLEEEKAKFEAEKVKIQEEKDKIENEKKEIAQKAENERLQGIAVEKAKIETENRMIAEQKKAEEQKIQREKEEKERLEADKKYNSWLKENKYDEKDCIIIDKKMYRFVSEYS